ncbi:MAG: dehydrogenase, short-chain alcohol dehydrogenase like [Actinomycetia bacterium]|jgi:NAD(P)-dependent dehydrogenase (short-subunit alcohol dehydrogenase family)|nr:dehydrogenase, short-chain alcohol dehydrogenase like [Actinomycetes bacterium]
MSDELDFAGKVAIVTGGCRGIGRGIASRFLEAGADVVVCCRHEPDTLPTAGERAAAFIAADVRDADEIDAVVQFTLERFGRIDVLVNNAGGSPPADTATASPKFSRAIIELNLVAPLLFAQKVHAVMRDQDDGGTIVNIASVSGVRPSPTTAAYGAAKAGLLNLTETLAVEFAPKVRVNAVTVGLVVTEQAHLFYGDDEGIAAVGATVPLGRMAQPSDVADVCLFLASPLARYVSGANVLVHGGGERPAYQNAAKNTERASLDNK